MFILVVQESQRRERERERESVFISFLLVPFFFRPSFLPLRSWFGMPFLVLLYVSLLSVLCLSLFSVPLISCSRVGGGWF